MKNKLKIIIPVAVAALAVILAAVFINFSPKESADISSLMSTAQKYLVEQNYEQAIAEFGKVIDLDPMNTDAYLGLADAYIGMGDTDSAIQWLEKGYELTGDERLKKMLDELTVGSAEPEVTTAAVAPDNEIVNNDDGSYYEMEFNTAGKIIHEDFYDENGNWWGSADIEYYPNGNKKKITYLREDGTYYIDEYDEEENLIRYTSYNADGSIYYYVICEYDSNGNMISDISYYGDDDSVKSYSKYEYDSNNYMIYQESYSSARSQRELYADENLRESTMSWDIQYNDDYTIVYVYPYGTNAPLLVGGEDGIKETYGYHSYDNIDYDHFIWKFDENGRKTGAKKYSKGNNDDSEYYSGYYEYFYDSRGNETELRVYSASEKGEMVLTSRHVYLYDGLNNIIMSTGYDVNGEIYYQSKY